MLDSRDLSAFCEQTTDEVYRYALRLTGGETTRSADLTQETYAALLRHVEQRPDDPVGLPWLITCCRHRHLDAIRSRRRRSRNQIRGWQPAVVEVDEGEDDVIAALGSLRPDERLVLVLRHVDGFSIAEIAETVGRSVAATDSMLRRGRDRLRSHILRERQEAERS
jgi:RNA polymerase sigma-70 factor (ECF subfamily)